MLGSKRSRGEIPVELYVREMFGFTFHKGSREMSSLIRFSAAAVCALVVAASSQAQTPALSRDTVNLDYPATQPLILNAKVVSVSSGVANGNTAVVGPGATITVRADYFIILSSNPVDYSCPFCFVQHYLAWNPAAAAEGASPVNTLLWDGQALGPGSSNTFEGSLSGTVTFTTTAPTTRGDYYIGNTFGFDFGANPAKTALPGFDTSIGVVGPARFHAILISVTSFPPVPCSGDSNGDRVVNFGDITNVLANFGAMCP